MLMCDAASYGVGTVLAHCMLNGSERPIGYASRTLTAAQRNYSQIEKRLWPLFLGYSIFIPISLGTTLNLSLIINHYWHFCTSFYLPRHKCLPVSVTGPCCLPMSTSGSETLMHTAMLMPSVGFLFPKPRKNLRPLLSLCCSWNIWKTCQWLPATL